ncbi:MAG: DUF1343 domain-containing protein [Bacteroidetes bacterium]|jgi:uncharacterized protein YbbC (DUF1343 family)|nr:DUF1343 domain-containing protein [Bacteroidota bacterium]
MRIKFSLIMILLASCTLQFSSAQQKLRLKEAGETIAAANLLPAYLNQLKDKNIALVANQSSIVGKTHLLDTLISSGIQVKVIFTPEHGFRGDQDAGASINNSKDNKTSLPIISLYGKHKMPKAADLAEIDLLVFDLQDVGVRFYTYISTLTYVMEACARQSIPVMVLDRPNPNGFFIDGPVLDSQYTSFVGLHKIPIVYGLTIGEYALMVNGEGWLPDGLHCDLTIIPMNNYDRFAIDKLPTKPSPNLPNHQSIYLYPSLCLFEGTAISIGRGTSFPFQVFGHPELKNFPFIFEPQKSPGASQPKHESKTCYGKDLRSFADNFQDHHLYQLNLDWIIEAYRSFPDKDSFFNAYFEKLAGTSTLRKQIEQGMSSEEIRASWKDELDAYKKIRIKYLQYPDFE